MPAADTRSTQALVEVADQNPASAELRHTQAVVETVELPLMEVWATQWVIEVAWPMYAPPPPPPPPPGRAAGANDAMLVLDLSEGRAALPNYGADGLPEY